VRELRFFTEANNLGLVRLVIDETETTFTREPSTPALLFFEMDAHYYKAALRALLYLRRCSC
jgi:hypothetical protein